MEAQREKEGPKASTEKFDCWKNLQNLPAYAQSLPKDQMQK